MLQLVLDFGNVLEVFSFLFSSFLFNLLKPYRSLVLKLTHA